MKSISLLINLKVCIEVKQKSMKNYKKKKKRKNFLSMFLRVGCQFFKDFGCCCRFFDSKFFSNNWFLGLDRLSLSSFFLFLPSLQYCFFNYQYLTQVQLRIGLSYFVFAFVKIGQEGINYSSSDFSNEVFYFLIVLSQYLQFFLQLLQLFVNREKKVLNLAQPSFYLGDICSFFGKYLFFLRYPGFQLLDRSFGDGKLLPQFKILHLRHL